ncbi:cytochrome C [Capilliphycus salinus ALCB114379]|uniref:cytochrome C n=1 Tax=Capilliphycus salinus TaxID=2768948 RepID=UPI0039A63BA4
MNQKIPVGRPKSDFQRQFFPLRPRSLRVLLLAIIFSLLGNFSANSLTPVSAMSPDPLAIPSNQIATVDRVPPRFELGQQLYLENCSGCHIALPPEVLPSQTWRQILQDTQHYGRQLKPLVDPPRLLIWNYLQTFSRPLNLEEEQLPFRVERSRFFRAIHPRVEFSQPISVNNCLNCHPSASEYNFRSLTSEWTDSP